MSEFVGIKKMYQTSTIIKKSALSLLGCLLILFGFQSASLGQTDTRQITSLNPTQYASVLIDATGHLSYQDILLTEYQDKFKPSSNWGEELNFGFSSSVYWIKVSLSGKELKASNWILEIPYFGLDHIDFYSPQGDVTKTGNLMSVGTRSIFYRYYAFPVELGNSYQDYYLRIDSKQNISVPLKLWKQSGFNRHIQTDTLIQALYYGGLGILAAFNFLIFLYLRDRSHFYYSGFAVLFGFGIFSGNGYGRLFIWPDSPNWDQISQVVLLTLATGMSLIFSTNFLNTKKNQPIVNWLFNILIFVLFSYAAIVVLTNYTNISKNLIFQIFPFIVLPVIGTVIYAGARAYQGGHYSARFFLISWGTLCVGGVLASLRQLDLIPTNWFTSYALQISSAIEMLLLSFALANRIQHERLLRETAQEEAIFSKETLVQTLRASEERLERQVFNRTNDLRTMLESEKKLREQYIRFGSLISHEFRNPLGIIENQVALLSRQTDNAHYKKRLSIISSATHRLALLFDRWLQGDRLESHVDTDRPQLIHIDSWLNDIVEKCKAYHPNHIFIYSAPKQNPVLVVDEKMLEVVVLNIIDNACKYSEYESTILIRMMQETNKVGISITDSGIGIDPINHKKIFEEFVQVHPESNKRGYGLGLSFVKKVIEFYGGSIQVNSALGKGSEFIAWFPEKSID
jgi:two-component system, sensor histidine kinase LadS